MKEKSVARKTAGAIYLIMAIMWSAIIAIMTGMNSFDFAAIFKGRIDSFDIIFLTLCVYTLLSLLLAYLLLTNFTFHARTLKMTLALAFVPLLAAPFSAPDFFGAVVYLIPYLFVYKFYKECKPGTPSFGNLRRIK